jgi:hypothetical protein
MNSKVGTITPNWVYGQPGDTSTRIFPVMGLEQVPEGH